MSSLRQLFQEWFRHFVGAGDGAVCISKFSADSLNDYLVVERGLSSGGPPFLIKHFHLGSELDLVETDVAPQQMVTRIFDRESHVFLMVGSIEPRKNHAFALDAFDRFWGQGGVGALVIVGNRSWMMEEFLARAAAHPQLGKQLFLVRDATDSDLAYCYKNASALIFTSEVEGFGLPIVESFQHGLRVICSDIPVFREIADGKAIFFALDDPAALDRCLVEFCTTVDPNDRTQRHPQPWLTWEQSTEQLMDAVQDVIRQRVSNRQKSSEESVSK